MSELTAYEIHAYQGGHWKIDSLFDDRALAIHEADRLQKTGRFPAVRVVEEKYDQESGQIKSRTIFRATTMDEHNAAALARTKNVRREVRSRARKPPPDVDFKAGKRRPKKAERRLFPIFMILNLGGIVLGGIAVILGLRYLAGGS